MEPWQYQDPKQKDTKSLVQTMMEAGVVIYAAFAITAMSVAAETLVRPLDKIRSLRKKSKNARS